MKNSKKIYTGSSSVLQHPDKSYLILGLGDHQTYIKIEGVELKEIKLSVSGNSDRPCCFEIPTHAKISEYYGRGWDFPYAQ